MKSLRTYNRLVIIALCTLLLGAPALFAAGMPPTEEKEEPAKEEQVEKKAEAKTEIPKEFAEMGLTFDLKDPKRIKNGEDIFRSTCAEYCHGQQPELFIDREGLQEIYVFETIRDGGGGLTPMPPWGEVFSKEEIWELVAFVKSLGKW